LIFLGLRPDDEDKILNISKYLASPLYCLSSLVSPAVSVALSPSLSVSPSVSISSPPPQNVEAKGLRDPSLEAPRRGAEVKDDDPIIPFGPQPTVSRFGAISRNTKTGYQTTGPVQAMATAAAAQNPSSKHLAMAAGEALRLLLNT